MTDPTAPTGFEYHPVDFVTGQPYAQWARARNESPLIDARSSVLGGATTARTSR